MKQAHKNINNYIPLFVLHALGVRLSGNTPAPRTRYQIMSIINQIDPFALRVTPGNLYKILDTMTKNGLIIYNQTKTNRTLDPILELGKACQGYYERHLTTWAQTETSPANIPALLALLSSEIDTKLIKPIIKTIKINLISDQEYIANILAVRAIDPIQGAKYWAPKEYRQKSIQSCLEVVLEFERYYSGD